MPPQGLSRKAATRRFVCGHLLHVLNSLCEATSSGLQTQRTSVNDNPHAQLTAAGAVDSPLT